MNYKSVKIDWGVLLTSVFFIFLFVYMIISNHNREEKWENPELEKRITIGTIKKYIRAGKSPDSFEYTFDYDGDTYEGTHLILSDIGSLSTKQLKDFIGRRYYVKFIVDDPDYSKLLISDPVTDTLKHPPKNGWVVEK